MQPKRQPPIKHPFSCCYILAIPYRTGCICPDLFYQYLSYCGSLLKLPEATSPCSVLLQRNKTGKGGTGIAFIV